VKKLIMAALMLLAATAQAADRKLPSKFVGDWCSVNTSNESAGATYRRGRCRDHGMGHDSGWMAVRVNGFDAHEQSCKVLSAVPKSGNYLAKFKCHGEGESWSVNHRMSLDSKGHLIMR
jgi:hypothetical protein